MERRKEWNKHKRTGFGIRVLEGYHMNLLGVEGDAQLAGRVLEHPTKEGACPQKEKRGWCSRKKFHLCK
jgi:hypothetical protein